MTDYTFNNPQESSRIDLKTRSREVTVLNRIAAIMSASADLAGAVPEALKITAEALGMRYATLALLNAKGEEVSIDIADGLTAEQMTRGRYLLGDGIIGRVAETGIVAVVPKISECAGFLNRTGIRTDGESSFICVPVIHGSEILGTISMDGDEKPIADLEEDAKLIGVVAAMLAQGIQTRRLLRESQEKLRTENERLKGELRVKTGPSTLVGKSREMQIVVDQIAQVADSSSTVLIHGETGTGKELVAQALHHSGSRADKPFIRVNCAALPETLIESELFGHEKGAFTGAMSSRKGRFEQADGGTIFLDEIGDITPMMQVKLLRVLQEREFERVGGAQTLKVDVRVIAATHRDLLAMTKQGKFRPDLYYRINVFPIHLMPLRKRAVDLPLLADHFLRKYSAMAGKDITSLSPQVLDLLAAYQWPGNVRELENAMEHAVIMASGSVILPEHLPGAIRHPGEGRDEPPERFVDYKAQVDNFERAILTEALRKTRGNVTQAAGQLGATPRVISYRVRQLGIDLGRF